MTTRLARRLGVPAMVLAAVIICFERALPPVALAVSGLLVGVVASVVTLIWFRFGVVRAMVALAILVGAIALFLVEATAPAAVPRAFATFLVVGLPAGGLPELRVVPFLVAVPAVTSAAIGVRRSQPWFLLLPAATSVVAAALLVAPVGVPWICGPLLVVVVGVLLATSNTDSDVEVPPLVGTATELHRRAAWWRDLSQALPTLLVAALAAFAPTLTPFDLRSHVSGGERVTSDPNPLAVTARMRSTDDAEPAATVSVRGPSPGRLRLAVLDRYAPTGWTQQAEAWVTGDALAPDPLQPERSGPRSTVEVTASGITSLFHAAPTAGTPRRTPDPTRILFDPRRSLIYPKVRGSGVVYETVPRSVTNADASGLTPTEVPADLLDCPRSEVIRSVASQLTAGAATPTDRLRRIEAWLLRTRMYDEQAPGGQTVGAVERFLSQPFARGNLEVFVTTFALLGRCSDVPTRVVVGFEQPSGASTRYSMGDLLTWVETPLDNVGWASFDPLPTPAEQELQAQLLAEEDDPPPPEPSTAPAVATTVAPLDPPSERDFPWKIPAGGAALVLVCAISVLASDALALRRSRRAASPAEAVLNAWSMVHIGLLDAFDDLGTHQTPTEVLRATRQRLPAPVGGLLSALVPSVDRARYFSTGVDDRQADHAWGTVDAVTRAWPSFSRRRRKALRHPWRTIRRSLESWRIRPGRRRWGATVDVPTVDLSKPPSDLEGFEFEMPIGQGSTSFVYRAIQRSSGSTVAVKVLLCSADDEAFDRARFEWECRVAAEVSGHDHLPELIASGVTPESGRPYFVSTYFESGSLHDELVRRGSLPEDEAIAVAIHVGRALRELHRTGVVHADVKPENVFRSARGWVLGDLGSAWTLNGRNRVREITPPYASPEVLGGAGPTPAADLYSLALTVFCAVLGHPPVVGAPPSKDEIDAVFANWPQLASCLSADPRQRPTNADALLQAIDPGDERAAWGRTPTVRLPGTTS